MLFKLDFANNTILSCLFFFFLIIDLYLLILAVITQIFNPTAELLIPTRIPTKEGKSEMETHPVTPQTKKVNFQYNSKPTKLFMFFTHQFILVYFFNEIIFCFIYTFQSKFLSDVFFSHD